MDSDWKPDTWTKVARKVQWEIKRARGLVVERCECIKQTMLRRLWEGARSIVGVPIDAQIPTLSWPRPALGEVGAVRHGAQNLCSVEGNLGCGGN